MGKRARGGKCSVFVRIRETAPDPAYRKRLTSNKTLFDWLMDFFSDKISEAIREREELLQKMRRKN